MWYLFYMGNREGMGFWFNLRVSFLLILLYVMFINNGIIIVWVYVWSIILFLNVFILMKYGLCLNGYYIF